MKFNIFRLPIIFFITLFISNSAFSLNQFKSDKDEIWEIGLGKEKITPPFNIWMAGFASREHESEGVRMDIWVKCLVLKSEDKRIAQISLDLIGLSSTVYEILVDSLNQLYGLKREELMFSFSHSHSGPRVFNDLVDYYPENEEEELKVESYSNFLIKQIILAVNDALNNSFKGRVYIGSGFSNFGINRRENNESNIVELLEEDRIKGPSDPKVPIMVVKNMSGNIKAILFGYACHATTLSDYKISGDYPGYAEEYLEKEFPGSIALFFAGAGADINPLPRRKVSLAKKYGTELGKSVENVIKKNETQILRSSLETSFEFVNLPYLKLVNRTSLLSVLKNEKATYRLRAARKMLYFLDKGFSFPNFYKYPLQTWIIGNKLIFIGMGGETVVDYSLLFRDYFKNYITWVNGFSNILVAYIPSKRVWDEGGYEGGHLDEYGLPAWRWERGVEDIIFNSVVSQTNGMIFLNNK